MSADVHIASLVAQFLPEARAALLAALATEAHTEIAAQSDCKLVLLVETGHERDIAALMTRLSDCRGVLGVHLVYHHVEPSSSLEEICHVPDPT
ncbi:chaperone NapD [Tahibacter amnicola]|uniref:Chaperone NapD n=1 Tax=Tahibacter amnicola TaxID=2976241 RepID=A0ABY6BM84_9GAMM|nr:chaperone NapD [Tahibacter amnicola]UXI70597.1 chaperone NapD [Tahibacter amnicola]